MDIFLLFKEEPDGSAMLLGHYRTYESAHLDLMTAAMAFGYTVTMEDITHPLTKSKLVIQSQHLANVIPFPVHRRNLAASG